MGSHIQWWLSALRSYLLKKREKQLQVFSPGLGLGLCWSQRRERHQEHIPVLGMEQNSPFPGSCLSPSLLPKSKIMGSSHILQILGHPAAPTL